MVKRFTEEKTTEEFDLVVIGGGITGAAVAYDAASRGLSVGLLEKGDFGGATSAATSKLIHGGLRYLAQMEIGLVRESLRERRILENIAPNLVYPMPFMITNYPGLKENKWFIKAGMILYDLLSYDKGNTWDDSKKLPLHRTISREEVLRLEPQVKKEGLTGASIYYDCLSLFPERLTLFFIKSAIHHGAKTANYTRVEDFLRTNGKITGVKAKDLFTGEVKEIRGKITINCAGTWADLILGVAKSGDAGHHVRRSEGIHIITKKLVNDHAIGTLTPEGRHFFVIPWRNHSLIGTTDKEYEGSPDEYRVTRESIKELLEAVNSSFGDGNLTYQDVKHAYGGLRPLVEDQTEETYESSRKYEIYDNANDGLEGLVTVEGGKYTTSRNLAEQAVRVVEKKLGKKPTDPVTDKSFLYGCDIPDLTGFLEDIKARHPGFSGSTMEYLGKYYGTLYNEVIDLVQENQQWAKTVNQDGEIYAQVVYAVRHEMAKTLSDIVLRRTGIGTLGHPGKEVLAKVADIAQKELGWDDAEKARQTEIVDTYLALP